MAMYKFRFIDLFCGIGGFHQALSSFGGECNFAAEIDPDCIEVYHDNYGLDAAHDMTRIDEKRVPRHEVLCGGFPCQAFSKAGKQAGVNDTRGTLFFEIERILRYHHPQFIILENVRNLVSHDTGRTWATITKVLKGIGYRLNAEPLILSPHQFGIPQLRERVYIVGKYDPDNVEEPLCIEFNNLMQKTDHSIYSILEPGDVGDEYKISDEELRALTAWDEFYHGINLKIIGFPVNTNYFHYEGDLNTLPTWKQSHIRRNKELYANNKAFIDSWLAKWNNLDDFTPTHHKFEWQCGTGITSVFEGLIQMRPSGIRVKMPNVFPALVAMVQIPIIGRYRRRLTERECARLQSFPDSFKICKNKHQALKQFGNSVNINVLKAIFKQLVEKYGPIEKAQPLPDSAAITYSAHRQWEQLSLVMEPHALYLSKSDYKHLVGSCRQGNRAWIKKHRLYNYPITDEELERNPSLLKINELTIMYRKRVDAHYYVESVEIVTRQQLAAIGYPIECSHHKANTKYLLYHLCEPSVEKPPIDINAFELIIGKGVKNRGSNSRRNR